MAIPVYSSVAAFIEHLRALDASPTLSAQERALRDAIGEVLELLDTAEREALFGPVDPSGSRRRERARLALQHLLKARGVLAA